MPDSLAAVVSAETAVGRPMATARKLVEASVSDNTRRAYAGALGQLDAWLAGRPLDDAALAAYLAALQWADVADAGGILVTVHRSKTNQAGETSDVRYPQERRRVVPLSPQMVGLRFTAAARYL